MSNTMRKLDGVHIFLYWIQVLFERKCALSCLILDIKFSPFLSVCRSPAAVGGGSSEGSPGQ